MLMKDDPEAGQEALRHLLDGTPAPPLKVVSANALLTKAKLPDPAVEEATSRRFKREILWFLRGFALWVVVGVLAFMGGYQLETWLDRGEPDSARVFSSRCMHAFGGGPVGARGDFLHYGPECRDELMQYVTSGAYDAEVASTAGAAIRYFKQLAATQPPARTDVIVFDIDETALSNRDTFFTAPAAAAAHGGHHGCGGKHGGKGDDGRHDAWVSTAASTSSSSSSGGAADAAGGVINEHGASIAVSMAADATGGAAAAATGGAGLVLPGAGMPAGSSVMAPPRFKGPFEAPSRALGPVLNLYRFLYHAGYSVAFLTGRSEDSRNATAANLAAAGYGMLCSQQTRAAADAVAAGTEVDFYEDDIPARYARPCYDALLLRETGDVRLASVYKPERRAQLAAAGYRIVGNIGDQFSDLVAGSSAPGSFKLPNPIYTLL